MAFLNRRSRSILYLAVVLVCACAYTACGSDGDDDANPLKPDSSIDAPDDSPHSNARG